MLSVRTTISIYNNYIVQFNENITNSWTVNAVSLYGSREFTRRWIKHYAMVCVWSEI